LRDGRSGGAVEEVAEEETIALDGVAAAAGDRTGENQPAVTKVCNSPFCRLRADHLPVRHDG
jgi:hypothetical protein